MLKLLIPTMSWSSKDYAFNARYRITSGLEPVYRGAGYLLRYGLKHPGIQLAAPQLANPPEPTLHRMLQQTDAAFMICERCSLRRFLNSSPNNRVLKQGPNSWDQSTLSTVDDCWTKPLRWGLPRICSLNQPRDVIAAVALSPGLGFRYRQPRHACLLHPIVVFS